MVSDRRRTLKLLRNALFAVASVSLAGACATTGNNVASQTKVAILLPLSGERAPVGQSLERAARLAQPRESGFLELRVYDTVGTAEGARLAARKAMDDGVRLVLGPLTADEVLAVHGETGSTMPILPFTNASDMAVLGNIYPLGITAEQNARAILTYARSRGVRRIAVASSPAAGPGSTDERELWDKQVAMAAADFADALDVTVITVNPNMLADLLQPDAILLPGGTKLEEHAAILADSNIQLLGTNQWLTARLTGDRNLKGAWFAAPDPAPFQAFSNAYARAHSERPGILAGIAFDAVRMAQSLVLMDRLPQGPGGGVVFEGVTGDLSFGPDNQPRRTMAIQTIGPQGLTVISTVQG